MYKRSINHYLKITLLLILLLLAAVACNSPSEADDPGDGRGTDADTAESSADADMDESEEDDNDSAESSGDQDEASSESSTETMPESTKDESEESDGDGAVNDDDGDKDADKGADKNGGDGDDHKDGDDVDDEGDKNGADDDDGDKDDDSDGMGQISGDDLEFVGQAFRATLEIEKMSMHIITDDFSDTQRTEVTVSFIRPDRYRMVAEGAEFIIIGEKTYLNSGDGNWIESPVPMTGMIEEVLSSFVSEEAVDENLDNLSEENGQLEFQGKENLNGIDTLKYAYTDADSEDELGRILIWIGEHDGLVYREEIEAGDGETRSLLLIEFSYGDDVVIEAPI